MAVDTANCLSDCPVLVDLERTCVGTAGDLNGAGLTGETGELCFCGMVFLVRDGAGLIGLYATAARGPVHWDGGDVGCDNGSMNFCDCANVCNCCTADGAVVCATDGCVDCVCV